MSVAKQTNAGRNLAGNTLWSFLGTAIFAGGRFAIIVLLTKQFDSEQVGRLLLAMAIVTPVAFLINMELRSVFVTDTHHRIAPDHCLHIRKYSNLIFLLMLLTLVNWPGWDWSWQKKTIIVLMGCVRSVESWADIYFGVLQKSEKMIYWAISRISKVVLVLVWAVVLPFFSDSIVWFPLGWFLVVAAVTWFYDRPVARGHLGAATADIPPPDYRRLIKSGAILGLFTALSILNHQAPQYFIARVLGDKHVAYFGVVILFVNGIVLVQNSINHAVISRMAVYYRQDTLKFLGLIGKLLLMTGSIMALALLVVKWQGDLILSVLFSAEYAGLSDLFFVVFAAGAVLVLGMILGDAVIATQQFTGRMAAVALGLGVNIAVCMFYLDTHGLTAAAWATFLSAVTITVSYAVLLIWNLRRRRGGQPPLRP